MLKKVLIVALLLSIAGSAFAGTPDVRILIDVSGSMRKTDPQNLRVPALRLVNGLLPLGSRAGVWLFAEGAEVLAQPATVDEAWKKQTAAKLNTIHSRGLFTDIEQAINAASAGWGAPDPDVDRHLILLTDGLVDVSKDSAESGASRQRVLSSQLAHLKEADVKVHTIALSDQVDKDLLRAMSTQTGGWMETAKTAEALQRAFLHMLEQAATPTTAPIKDNAFEIDSQVSEFTLLAFRDANQTTELISPSGKRFTAKTHPTTATWREEAGYDLVTLRSPETGKWQLKGVTDPDNRVALVTDLGIGVGDFPSVIPQGSSPEVQAWLTDHQQPVTQDGLLELVTAQATITIAGGQLPALAPAQGKQESPSGHPGVVDPQADAHGKEVHGKPQEQPSAQDAAPQSAAGSHDGHDGSQESTERTSGSVRLELDAKTGRFVGHLDATSLPPGDYEVRINLDGGTFQREAIKHFEISGPPLEVAFSQKNPSNPGEPAALIVTFDGKRALIDASSLGGYLTLTGPDQQERVIDLPQPKRLPTGFRLPIERPGQYSVKGRVIGQSPKGEVVDLKIDPQQFTFEFALPEAEAEQTAEEPESEPVAWLQMLAYVGGGNAGLGTVLGLTFWLLRRPKTGDDKGKEAKGKAAKGKKK